MAIPQTPTQKSAASIWARLPDALPFLFFALLFAFTLKNPPLEAFDEFHYVTASKELISLESNRNWEHPPLAKLIMGASWKLFTVELDWLNELAAMRLMAVLFGMGVLAVFRLWCLQLGFSAAITRALVWTVGFNMAWYVQSKTAMLDIFSLFFGLAGTLVAARAKRPAIAGVLLGLGMACKWSALPFLLLAMWLARKAAPRQWAVAMTGAVLVYASAFIPLAMVKRAPVPPQYLHTYHQSRMLGGLQSTSDKAHSYRSNWWQWLTLNRPMWYTFSKAENVEPPQYHCVFMGGNPFIFWPGLLAILTLIAAWLRHRRRFPHRREALVLAFFAIPLLIWIPSPRKLMFFYYVIPSSLWFGPAIALALGKFMTEAKAERALWAVVILAGAFFFFMLPLLTGQAVSFEAFRTFYQPWMARLNWI